MSDAKNYKENSIVSKLRWTAIIIVTIIIVLGIISLMLGEFMLDTVIVGLLLGFAFYFIAQILKELSKITQNLEKLVEYYEDEEDE